MVAHGNKFVQCVSSSSYARKETDTFMIFCWHCDTLLPRCKWREVNKEDHTTRQLWSRYRKKKHWIFFTYNVIFWSSVRALSFNAELNNKKVGFWRQVYFRSGFPLSLVGRIHPENKMMLFFFQPNLLFVFFFSLARRHIFTQVVFHFSCPDCRKKYSLWRSRRFSFPRDFAESRKSWRAFFPSVLGNFPSFVWEFFLPRYLKSSFLMVKLSKKMHQKTNKKLILSLNIGPFLHAQIGGETRIWKVHECKYI